MKKIIDGKLYNTETATHLGSYWNGLSKRDFRYCEETLYRKKNGEYFCHGSGGAMTCYASRHGDTRSEGEMIVPMTEAEAKRWAEDYLTVEEYIAAFGEPEE